MKLGIDNTEKNLARATNLLQELDQEEQKGFNLGGAEKGGKQFSNGLEAQFKKQQDLEKKDSSDKLEDNYDDDFDEIEEDLPEEANDPMADADANERSANVAVTVS